MRRWDTLGFAADTIFVHDPATVTQHVLAAAKFGFLRSVRRSECMQTGQLTCKAKCLCAAKDDWSSREHSSNLRENSSTAAASFSARIRASRRHRSFRPFVLSKPNRSGPPLEEAPAIFWSWLLGSLVEVMPRFKADGINVNKEQRREKQLVKNSNFDMRNWVALQSNVCSKTIRSTALAIVWLILMRDGCLPTQG